MRYSLKTSLIFEKAKQLALSSAIDRVYALCEPYMKDTDSILDIQYYDQSRFLSKADLLIDLDLSSSQRQSTTKNVEESVKELAGLLCGGAQIHTAVSNESSERRRTFYVGATEENVLDAFKIPKPTLDNDLKIEDSDPQLSLKLA